ncbi:hypothetical protein NMY22_g3331 [Coprinellus aureogranulatus]|nr:hypothetical protein NMY22_g3331 [Coprinellus aureogranulatus]
MTIAYVPVHPEHDKTQLTIHKNDLPEAMVCPASGGLQLGTVTIRTMSVWRAKSLKIRSPGLAKRGAALVGLKRGNSQPQHRKDADIVFCTELAAPRGAAGRSSVSPHMDICF